LAAELGDQPSDVALPESQRRDHAQMACHHAPAACQFVGQVAQFAADLFRPQRQQPAFVGQRGAASRTVDQPDPQPFFQRMQSLGDCGRRDIQRARR
jgi:hypothetical protein